MDSAKMWLLQGKEGDPVRVPFTHIRDLIALLIKLPGYLPECSVQDCYLPFPLNLPGNYDLMQTSHYVLES